MSHRDRWDTSHRYERTRARVTPITKASVPSVPEGWPDVQAWAREEVRRLRAIAPTDPWAAVKAGTWPATPQEVKE